MKKAYYRGIPCYFDLDTSELVGRNWFYDILVDINIWIDLYIVDVEFFPIEIEDD
jgi:hypothetical protein